MKISLKWLNDYVDVNDYFKKTDELAAILTRAGLEVEEITDLAKALNHVVVGHVTLKDKHPNSDKLSLCQVEVAPGKIEQIVCGAQNHKTGDKVVVALPGAVLPGNFAIKKSKIRDMESNGMLCSFKELGVDKPSDGIVILPADAPVGTPYADYAGIGDVTFELKVTPNRADCLSHYGLAREIGCLLNRPVKKIETFSKFSSNKTTDKIKLSVESDLCIRYSGRYMSGVKIGPSPEWLKARLESIGMNSINNVVDVTNYVMLELGQPLHAFDADSLAKSTIQVRKAQPNEKFKTLKEQDLVLKGEELLICDGEKAVALAGVIGGLNSGVSDKTQNIFIESANFNALSTRKSARSNGIETDSAYRFARGVDASGTVDAMDRAVLLISQCAGGEAFGTHHDIYPKPVTKNAIDTSIKTISDRLGYAAEAPLFEQFMTGLQCKVTKKSDGLYSVTPPLFRFDMEQEMDLVEEYARLNGYEKIQETLPVFDKQPTHHDAFYALKNKISGLMQASGFSQAFNYAFTSQAAEQKFMQSAKAMQTYGFKIDDESVTIRNPLSEEWNAMRRLTSFSIWKNTTENFHMGNERGQLFEIGTAFTKSESGYTESNRMAIASWGNEFGLYSNSTPNVYKVRASIERLFSMLGISSYTFKDVDTKVPFLHFGQSAQIIVEGKAVGFIGTVHPQLIQQEKIRVDVAIAELNLDIICQGQPRPMRFKSVSTFQTVERDFSFVVDANKSMGEFFADVKKSLGGVCKDVRIFDIYQGDKLDSKMKSVSVRVTMQSADADLTEAQITENVNKVMASAEKTIGAKLR